MIYEVDVGKYESINGCRDYGAGTNSSSPCSTVIGIFCPVKKYYPCGNIILNCVCLGENFDYGIDGIKNK
ncbi:MAG: hypothetical protein E7C38_06085 [Finegoldia magna]|nr:hypothetical protein [Finegoldia magna]